MNNFTFPVMDILGNINVFVEKKAEPIIKSILDKSSYFFYNDKLGIVCFQNLGPGKVYMSSKYPTGPDLFRDGREMAKEFPLLIETIYKKLEKSKFKMSNFTMHGEIILDINNKNEYNNVTEKILLIANGRKVIVKCN